MPKNNKDKQKNIQSRAIIKGAGVLEEKLITDTLEENYMPYAMSVIVSRAIPEIDGFKPSHRKLLFTMYEMGLLTSQRTKSANVVGQTMRLNPHGDQAIYETMVRLTRGNETLLHPYIDSKGNFGKAYSRDMAYAASRYTEVKLAPISQELFRDIEKNTVDFVDNYDNTRTEPSLLPAGFPSILVNINTGIAVGMASNICSFNLGEVCRTTIALIKNPDADLIQTLPAPDFAGGGYIIYDHDSIEKVYNTGRGNIRVRAKYTYDSANNCIEIFEIPPTTTIEAIIEKIVDLVKSSKIREISDIRDESDLGGLKITIDLKRGVNPDKLMAKLFRFTTLEDNFSCNFNVLIAGIPRVMGIRELLNEWIAFRLECVRRRIYYDIVKAKEKLHLLKGLSKILLDIDKAIKIIRETDEENEVIPNLMVGFGIDELQAEYVASIRLRHLNKEYILKRTEETGLLAKEIAEMEETLNNKSKLRNIIINELEDIIKKYAIPRKSEILYADDLADQEITEEVPNYPVNLFFTKEGYFKKITPASLRMSSEHKLKEDDYIIFSGEYSNNHDLLFFTNKCQVYKSKASDFEEQKASALGEYIPARLGMDEGELPLYMAVTDDYSGYMLFCFENGKIAKVSMKSYYTKTNRRKLVGAISDKSPLVRIYYIDEDKEFVITSSSGRKLLFHSGAIGLKSAKNSQGVQVVSLKKGQRIVELEIYDESILDNPNRYRVKNLPAAGALPPKKSQVDRQLSLD